jgi:hypothetical protein
MQHWALAKPLKACHTQREIERKRGTGWGEIGGGAAHCDVTGGPQVPGGRDQSGPLVGGNLREYASEGKPTKRSSKKVRLNNQNGTIKQAPVGNVCLFSSHFHYLNFSAAK